MRRPPIPMSQADGRFATRVEGVDVMKSTDNLRRQHRELLRIATEIGVLIRPDRMPLTVRR